MATCSHEAGDAASPMTEQVYLREGSPLRPLRICDYVSICYLVVSSRDGRAWRRAGGNGCVVTMLQWRGMYRYMPLLPRALMSSDMIGQRHGRKSRLHRQLKHCVTLSDHVNDTRPSSHCFYRSHQWPRSLRRLWPVQPAFEFAS
jgi:hypothetical protein